MDEPSRWARRTSTLAYVSGGIVVLSAVLLGVRLALGPPVSNPDHPSRLIVEFLDTLGSASVAPVTYAFHQLYTRESKRLGGVAMLLGFTSSVMGATLNGLFLLGVFEFGQGLGVTLAFFAGLAVQGSWLILAGLAAQKGGKLPRGLLMGVIGAIGYPIWAIWIGWRSVHPRLRAA